MKNLFRGLIKINLIVYLSAAALSAQIHLHPQNPHYFKYKEKPLFLIASSEHYGAVINKNFDYVKYLNTLKKYRVKSHPHISR